MKNLSKISKLMKSKLFPIVLVAITIISCSSPIPTNVEPSVMKDVYPLPIDTLYSFIGLSKEDALYKIVSYSYTNIEQDNSKYDYDIQGQRDFKNYKIDEIKVTGDKGKYTRFVSYTLEFGTLEMISDADAYFAAQQKIMSNGIIPIQNVISCIETLKSDYLLGNVTDVHFNSGKITWSRSSSKSETIDNYDEFLAKIKSKKPYSLSCRWESDNYDVSHNSYLNISYNPLAFSITISDNK